MEIKYLRNGASVSVIGNTEWGFAVRNVNVEDGEYYEDGITYLVPEIFDKQKPIQYFDTQILKLKETVRQLNEEIRRLREERQRLQNNIITAKTKKVHVNFS